MTINLVTINTPNHEKLNLELDASGVWTLRKNTTPYWRQYCHFPNGSWAEINGMFGRELVLRDADKQRCFSLLSWGNPTGKAQMVKNSTYGDWAFTTRPKHSDARLTIGLGIKAGGFLPNLPVAGGEAAALMVYTPDQGTYATPYGIPTVRLGLGGGASTGVILAIIRGFSSTSALHGFQVSGFDTNLSFGTKIAHQQMNPEFTGKLAEFFKYLLRSGWSIPDERWNDALTMVKNAVCNAPDIDSGIAADIIESPSVEIWDIPFIGAGVEVSFFHMAGIMFKMDFLSFSQWMAEKNTVH